MAINLFNTNKIEKLELKTKELAIKYPMLVKWKMDKAVELRYNQEKLLKIGKNRHLKKLYSLQSKIFQRQYFTYNEGVMNYMNDCIHAYQNKMIVDIAVLTSILIQSGFASEHDTSDTGSLRRVRDNLEVLKGRKFCTDINQVERFYETFDLLMTEVMDFLSQFQDLEVFDVQFTHDFLVQLIEDVKNGKVIINDGTKLISAEDIPKDDKKS